MGAGELSPACSITPLYSPECEAGVRGREDRQRQGEGVGRSGLWERLEGLPGALATERSPSPAGDPRSIPEVPQASFPPVGWAEERHFLRRLVDEGEMGWWTPGRHVVSVRWFVIVVQSLSRVQPFVTPWTAACQASLFLTISQSLPKFMSIESVMLSDRPTLCCPLLLLPSTFPTGPLVFCTFIPFLAGSRGDLKGGIPLYPVPAARPRPDLQRAWLRGWRPCSRLFQGPDLPPLGPGGPWWAPSQARPGGRVWVSQRGHGRAWSPCPLSVLCCS